MSILTFQLRAARSVLNLGVRDIESLLKISRSTISIWENKENLEIIKTSQDNIYKLIEFFENNKIVFPNSNAISFLNEIQTNLGFLTRFHLRGARSILNITQNELSLLAKIPLPLLNYLESHQANDKFLKDTPKGHEVVKYDLHSFFKSKGITFPNDFTIYFSPI